MSTFQISDHQWQAYKQGNDVWVRPVNPYREWIYKDKPENHFANKGYYRHTNFEEFAKQHAYPAPDLEDGRVYNGVEVEVQHQYEPQDEDYLQWLDCQEGFYSAIKRGNQKRFEKIPIRIIMRLKQPTTPTSEGKGETVEEAAHRLYPIDMQPEPNQWFGEYDTNVIERDTFIEGANWQSQHSQSLDIRRVLEYVATNVELMGISHHQSKALYDTILAMQPEIEKILKEK